MDRRIKRTKAAIFNAVLDLSIENGCDKMTVLELCKRADINKSTFYLHYKSIDDCVQKCFSAILKEVENVSKQINYNDIKENPKPFVDKLIDEILKAEDYYCRFKDSKIYGASIRLLKENYVKNICEHNGLTKENNYYEVVSITFAVAGVTDAIIEMLPITNKELVSKAICSMIKSHSNYHA